MRDRNNMSNKHNEVYERMVSRHEKDRLPSPLKGMVVIVLMPFILIGLCCMGVIKLTQVIREQNKFDR